MQQPDQQQQQQQEKPLSPLEAAFHPSVIAALANLGNTCFANSSLQVIANLKDIIGAIRFVGRFGLPPDSQNQNVGVLPPSHRGRSANVVRCTAQTLNNMENGADLIVRPIELIRSVQEVNETFASGIGEQHDAAEWLLHGVLDACDDYNIDRSISAKHLAEAFDDLKDTPPGQTYSALGARCTYGRLWTSHSKMNVWRTMAQVDEENAKEEWEDKKKKNGGLPIAGDYKTWKKNNYCSPFLARSHLLDAMRGTFLQETRCSNCGYTSRIFNPLTSFELSFPSAAERMAYRDEVEAQKEKTKNQKQFTHSAAAASNGMTSNDNNNNSTEDCGITPASSLFWKILFLPCAIFTSIGRVIYRCCSSLFSSPPEEPVTLDELLWAYCRSRGTNMRCSKCQKESRGTITMKILDLPQVLAIHLKRFEQSAFGGLWTEKIPDHVEFPGSFDATLIPENNNINQATAATSSSSLNSHLEHHRTIAFEHGSPLSPLKSGNGLVLDLSPYIVTDNVISENDKQETSNNSNKKNSNNNKWIVPQVTTFNLNAVINHHGGLNSGHYTAFCKKAGTSYENEKPRWALFNDAQAGQVSQEQVLQSQAYVLTYEKEALCKENEEMKNLRKIAKEYLVGSRRNVQFLGAEKVSRLWLFRVASYCDPGPLLHRLDEFEDKNTVPPAKFVYVSKQDFNTLVEAYGELLLPKL